MWSKFWDGQAARRKWEAELTWYRLRYLEAAGPTRCLTLLSRPQACGRLALIYYPETACTEPAEVAVAESGETTCAAPGETANSAEPVPSTSTSSAQALSRYSVQAVSTGSVARLYLGVPALHGRLLQRMVADFGFSLKPPGADLFIPPAQPLTAVADFPWKRPFVGQIVDGVAFVSLAEEAGRGGAFMPQPPAVGPKSGLNSGPNSGSESVAPTWSLPVTPPPGLTLRTPSHEVAHAPPPHLVAANPDPRRWLLGRSAHGLPVQVAGRVNLYGRQEAVADWLVAQVTQQLALDHANLVVIDGSGTLVARLKRKTAVTRLLGKQLTYVDLDGATLADGFNPLAAVPGESEAKLVGRWQTWFAGMNVHPYSSSLLAQARQAGVADISGLRKWLQQVERHGRPAALPAANGNGSGAVRHWLPAVSSLSLALNRLTAGRRLREWLEWPANRFEGLPDGGLLFACQGTSWDRQQVLRAVLLAACQLDGVRLVLYGLPWPAVAPEQLAPQVVIGNGPLLPGATVVLTESHDQGAAALAGRFLAGDARLQENLALLGRGEGLVVSGESLFFTAWAAQGTRGG
jgi:hypothetical protein